MTIQTLTLGKKKFVILPEKDFRRLQKQASASTTNSPEDRRDAATLRRRLASMRRRNEKPHPYLQARKDLGLE